MASSTQSLVDLANDILNGATTLQKELAKENLPQPSFTLDGLKSYHDVHFNPVAMEARTKLIEAARNIYTLALGPSDALRIIANTERMRVNTLRALHELSIANAVPVDGSISIDELASKVGAHPNPLRRVMRLAYTMHIFQEPLNQPDFVAHTPMSALLPTLSPYLWLQLSDSTQMQASSWQLPWGLRNWPRAPINKSDSAGRDFWTIIRDDEPEGRGMSLFAGAMSTQMQSMHGTNSRHLAASFDWGSLGEGVVVDIGGGSGHLSIPVAQEFPQLQFVVQDLLWHAGTESAR